MKILKEFGKLLKAKTIQNVAIFGSAHAREGSLVVKDAYEVCKTLATSGYTIINGGGPGVMRAATEGAKEGNGKVIGVTLMIEDLPEFEGKDPKNLFDTEIRTKNYIERTLALLAEGQIYVIFNGGTGTISEFGMAWGLAKLYFGHHKPLILYGKFWEEIIKVFKENMMLTPEELEVYKIVNSPQEVLQAIKDFEEELQRGEHRHIKTTKSEFSI